MASLATALALVVGANILLLQRAAWAVADRPGNSGIEVFAYHRYGVIPGEIVFDLRDVDLDRSAMDVTRFLLMFAAELKDRSFERVILAWRGEPRFVPEGRYFQRIGREYGFQNPVYTVRTLPENLYRPSGRRAFGTWTGGWLGVLGEQLDDLNAFHREWYIDAL